MSRRPRRRWTGTGVLGVVLTSSSSSAGEMEMFASAVSAGFHVLGVVLRSAAVSAAAASTFDAPPPRRSPSSSAPERKSDSAPRAARLAAASADRLLVPAPRFVAGLGGGSSRCIEGVFPIPRTRAESQLGPDASPLRPAVWSVEATGGVGAPGLASSFEARPRPPRRGLLTPVGLFVAADSIGSQSSARSSDADAALMRARNSAASLLSLNTRSSSSPS
mmetsp:Transcript_3299/g.12345  ORF Transcript_3299/g.12345 Transcript_3299/m.12345 type:complete len:220 (+) Transcript_3299:1019-1678(+)